MVIIDKWKGLPFAVKCYFVGLMLIGLIPLTLSFVYPLHRVNAEIDSVVTGSAPEITYEQYKHMNDKTVPVETRSAILSNEPVPASAPILPPTPEVAASAASPMPVAKTDWVQIIGGVNSAVLSWVIYFDRRKRKRKQKDEDKEE